MEKEKKEVKKEIREEEKKVEERLEDCEKRRKELEEYAKRLKASFENYKREVAQEKQKIIRNANEYLVGKLVSVLDDFDRALGFKDDCEAFREGIEKIFKKLLRILENEGLGVVDPSGGKFDPFEHEAFEKVEREDVEEYTVLEVVEKGYKFHGKVIKPAKVKVAIKPREKPPKEGGDEG